ncbi:MAG TPA: site-specific integrase [Candidatus Onthenecus intestinigallinarum]|uniref:Site-specific integrase n=1 Tax=Candidatus Onthenecus intestinigallinarum TaxID=2840875 RepID=A0A9D0ZB18_9FIRM|nr:site-specific integrase [Candidatus Onthenecus intestinigallinarum]
MTYDEWYTQYLALYKPNLRAKTLESYGHIHGAVISPLIGGHDLTAITAEDVQRVLLAAARHGPRLAQIAHALLRAVLRRAVRSRLISWSPVDAVDRPAHAPAEGAALSDDEYAAALPVLLEDLPLALAVLAGLRRGEICGLQWGDVDLAAGLIHVRRTRVRCNGRLVTGPPKSAAGVRSVPIGAPLRPVLARAFVLCPDSWVCPYAPEGLSRRWGAIQRTLHLSRRYRLHDLRHTHATILLANSIDVVAVATRLGHSDASTTLKVYAHALRRRDEDAARAAQGLLDRAADDLAEDKTEN